MGTWNTALRACLTCSCGKWALGRWNRRYHALSKMSLQPVMSCNRLLCGQLPFGEHAENDREAGGQPFALAVGNVVRLGTCQVCRAVLAGKPRIPSSLEDSSQRILVKPAVFETDGSHGSLTSGVPRTVFFNLVHPGCRSSTHIGSSPKFWTMFGSGTYHSYLKHLSSSLLYVVSLAMIGESYHSSSRTTNAWHKKRELHREARVPKHRARIATEACPNLYDLCNSSFVLAKRLELIRHCIYIYI